MWSASSPTRSAPLRPLPSERSIPSVSPGPATWPWSPLRWMALVDVAVRLLEAGAAVVTDVGSVKAPVAEAVADPRFVAGHPMAGNEQEGLAGASADLFRGAVWVLTPTPHTRRPRPGGGTQDSGRHGCARHSAHPATPRRSGGGGLPCAASRSGDADAHGPPALVRAPGRAAARRWRIPRHDPGGGGAPRYLARHMLGNRVAIVSALDELIDELADLRRIVSRGERSELLERLEAARRTRLNLPTTATEPSRLSELRIPGARREGPAGEDHHPRRRPGRQCLRHPHTAFLRGAEGHGHTPRGQRRGTSIARWAWENSDIALC